MEYLTIFIESLIDSYSNQPWVFIVTVTSFILYILIKIFYPKFRGYMGEFWVKKELSKLPKGEYIILNDLLIVTDDKTSQIDHIVISKFGIFVIEMKNYYGYIRGNEYQQNWSQYFGKKKFSFYNPIHQNYGHIKMLEKVLELPYKVFIPIICFSNQATLKVNSTKTRVVQLDDLVSTILNYDEIILYNLEDIANKLIKANKIGGNLRKEHITRIKADNIKRDEDEKNDMPKMWK